MYEVINESYPALETYLCYRCGFHADTILMEQHELYAAYQELFIHSNGWLVPEKLPPTKMQQPKRTPSEGNTTIILVGYC